MDLIVNVIDGEIKLVSQDAVGNAMNIGSKYPFGDVYVRFVESQGVQWRILQRGTRDNDKFSYFNMLLPIKVDQLPEIVQVVHTCTN